MLEDAQRPEDEFDDEVFEEEDEEDDEEEVSWA